MAATAITINAGPASSRTTVISKAVLLEWFGVDVGFGFVFGVDVGQLIGMELVGLMVSAGGWMSVLELGIQLGLVSMLGFPSELMRLLVSGLR
jgi:hypothetical protein